MAGRRFERVGNAETTGVTLHADRLEQPLRWRKPRRVFVCSLADLFHDDVPDVFIRTVFTIMASTEHTYQVLTKRPERMRDFLSGHHWRAGLMPWAGPKSNHLLYRFLVPNGESVAVEGLPGSGGVEIEPPDNIWLGVSIENDRWTRRADVLRETPAAVRFISAEPLLGPLPSLDMTNIDWIIIGGESGPGARPFDIEHARGIIRARAARVWRNPPALFVKQLGSRPIRSYDVDGHPCSAPVFGVRDRKGGDPEEWPADLRIREFPRVLVAA